MSTATSCVWFDEATGETSLALDPSVVAPGCEARRCPDCKVMPGGAHHGGCDVERCSACGGQWISCGHEEHDGSKTRWTGEWPGVAECRAAGLFCRDFHADGTPVTEANPIDWDKEWGKIRFHVPCGPDDEGAHPDLNRWTMIKTLGVGGGR
jgi:hypothetical protein